MKTIHLVANGFVDNGMRPNVGGVESYIQLLARAVASKYQLRVYQSSPVEFEQEIADVCVIGCGRIGIRDLVRRIEKQHLQAEDILLFSTDQFCCDTKWSRSGVIQHGISWDIPTDIITSRRIPRWFERAYRVFLSLRNHWRVQSFRNIICVDYNYANWYRTLAVKEDLRRRFYIIPNCAGDQFWIDSKIDGTGALVICFARRFVEIRGISSFISVAERLLRKYTQVRFVFCGDGPPEVVKRLQALSEADPRVEVIRSAYAEMASIYSRANVVVIPSIASEGTSLSAVEAMAMGKCVVASNVGGLTNIIVDGFNGYLVAPTGGDLEARLEYLIENPTSVTSIGHNARAVAEHSFTFDVWARNWLEALERI